MTSLIAPSGEGLFFLFHDLAANPSNVTNVVDNNELQSFTLSGNPAGGAFTLTCNGQTTASIPAIPSLPYRYFQWNGTLAAPGTYDLAVNILVGGSGTPNQIYEVFDGTTSLGTVTLNHSFSGGHGGPFNPTPFADPGGLLNHAGGPLLWYPLGRYTFGSTALHVRTGCSPDADGENRFDADNLRIATTDGATVVRLGPNYPPATVVSPGFWPDQGAYSTQAADDTINTVSIDGLGTGTRYLVDPAVVKSRLEALSSVGPDGVTVTGDGSPIAPIRLAFGGLLAGVAVAPMVASDSAVTVTEVARGGVIPSIRVNGGSGIPLSAHRMHYYAGTPAMPGVYFPFPQDPPAATYLGVRHSLPFAESVTSGNWQQAPFGYAGYTDNAMLATGVGPTATWNFRPVTAGSYRASFSWIPDASYSADVVYTVATTYYLLTQLVYSNGATQVLGEAQLYPIGTPTTVSAGSSGNVLAVSVVVRGLDVSGNPVAETLPAFTPGGSSTVSGSTVFSRISSITMPALGDTGSLIVVYANPIAVGTYHADQRAAPSGALDHGVHWLVGDTIALTGDNNGLVVTQANGTSGTMIADTVRFERLSGPTALKLASSDVVTYSTPGGWATAQSGTAPAATDAPVTNLVGRTLYPPLPSSVTMGVGLNLAAHGPQTAVCLFNDLLHMTELLQDFPAVIPGSFYNYPLNYVNPTISSENKATPNLPNGRHILWWKSGASDLRVNAQSGSASEYAATNYPAATGTWNKRYYDFAGDNFFYGAQCFLTIYGTTPTGVGSNHLADVTEAHLLPEGLDPATAPKFRANVLAHFAGMKGIRCLDSSGAIDKNPTDFADINPPASWVTRGSPVRTVRVRPHTITDYAGSVPFDRTNVLVALVTTSAPHGLASGHIVTFEGFDPIPLADGLGNTQSDDINGRVCEAVVIDATSFVFILYTPWAVAGHPWRVSGTVTDPPGSVVMNAGSGFRLGDQVDLCNAVGADMHWNMGFTATDDCLTQFGDYCARHLTGKLRHAAGNEVWNNFNFPYAVASTGTHILYGGSPTDPVPFTCQAADHQWAVTRAAWVAAGRDPADYIRVMEGFYYNPGFTVGIAEYCHDHGITFDEFAVAPYVGNRPAFTVSYQDPPQFGPTVDGMTGGQILDMYEYNATYGRYETEFPAHRNALIGPLSGGTYARPEFLGVKMPTYEGGPEPMLPQGGQLWNAGSRCLQAVYDPRWMGIYEHILLQYQDSAGPGTGCTLFQDYLHNYVEQGGPLYQQWAVYRHTADRPYVPGDPTQDAVQRGQFWRMTARRSVTGGALLDWASRLDATPSPDFTVSLGGTVTLVRGASGTATVAMTVLDGYAGTATVAAPSGLPSGVTASAWSPTAMVGTGAHSASATLSASPSAVAGTYSYSVTVADPASSLSHVATGSLVVTDPPASRNPVNLRRMFRL